MVDGEDLIDGVVEAAPVRSGVNGPPG
jgi:hypothetical protein